MYMKFFQDYSFHSKNVADIQFTAPQLQDTNAATSLKWALQHGRCLKQVFL